jgi:alkylation response protein AidB-like acyl-CoA dehydrogenase
MPSIAASSSPSAVDPVERIARIADVIGKSGAANEALGRLTPEVVAALHEQRIFRLLLPRVYGGDEVDLATWFRSMEALAKLDASTAWCVGQINGCSGTASALDPAVARKMWSELRSALSWGPPVKARADEVDGGHRLTGEWMMSSGSRHATWIGLLTPIYGRDGAPIQLPDGITTRIFLVPATSVEFLDNWDTIGLTATNSGGFKVNNLFVPEGYSICREFLPDVRLDGPLYKFPLNCMFATGFSGVALGIARTMLDAAFALAMEKKPRLAKQSLIDNHMVQFQLGEAEARLRSARGYVEATVGRVFDEVEASGKLTIPQRIDIRMATTFAIHEAKAVADAAWEVAGATAIFASGPFERRFRDLYTMLQQVQGRRSHLQDTGAFLLGLEPNLTFA